MPFLNPKCDVLHSTSSFCRNRNIVLDHSVALAMSTAMWHSSTNRFGNQLGKEVNVEGVPTRIRLDRAGGSVCGARVHNAGAKSDCPMPVACACDSQHVGHHAVCSACLPEFQGSPHGRNIFDPECVAKLNPIDSTSLRFGLQCIVLCTILFWSCFGRVLPSSLEPNSESLTCSPLSEIHFAKSGMPPTAPFRCRAPQPPARRCDNMCMLLAMVFSSTMVCRRRHNSSVAQRPALGAVELLWMALTWTSVGPTAAACGVRALPWHVARLLMASEMSVILMGPRSQNVCMQGALYTSMSCGVHPVGVRGAEVLLRTFTLVPTSNYVKIALWSAGNGMLPGSNLYVRRMAWELARSLTMQPMAVSRKFPKR